MSIPKETYAGSTFQQAHALVISLYEIVMMSRKDRQYGESWRKRGGTDSFFMLARKWDRIENFCKEHGWNILEAIHHDTLIGGDSMFGPEGIIQDIHDLRNYLLLPLTLKEANRPDPIFNSPDVGNLPSPELNSDLMTRLVEILKELNFTRVSWIDITGRSHTWEYRPHTVSAIAGEDLEAGEPVYRNSDGEYLSSRTYDIPAGVTKLYLATKHDQLGNPIEWKEIGPVVEGPTISKNHDNSDESDDPTDLEDIQISGGRTERIPPKAENVPIWNPDEPPSETEKALIASLEQKFLQIGDSIGLNKDFLERLIEEKNNPYLQRSRHSYPLTPKDVIPSPKITTEAFIDKSGRPENN